MMFVDFSTKQDATVPPIEAQLTDGAGVVNLMGATVAFWMRSLRDGEVKIENAAAEVLVEDPALLIPDEPNVRYRWSEDDVDTPGIFEAQWLVTYEGGGTQRFPTDPDRPYVVIEIQPA
jgi:hypothetical protein